MLRQSSKQTFYLNSDTNLRPPTPVYECISKNQDGCCILADLSFDLDLITKWRKVLYNFDQYLKEVLKKQKKTNKKHAKTKQKIKPVS